MSTDFRCSLNDKGRSEELKAKYPDPGQDKFIREPKPTDSIRYDTAAKCPTQRP